MDRFAHLATRLFNVPLAIHPRKAEIAIAALAERLGITRVDGLVGASVDDGAFSARDVSVDRDGGYDVVHGVAIMEVCGTLVHRSGYVRPFSGMSGYDGIRVALSGALADSGVRAVALLMNSPGGEVAGCADLFETILSARGDKPIWAICDDMAYSAAYWLASACDRITVPRTGGTGSIGVIAMHVDMSQAIERAGLKVTFLTSQGADRKTDGRSELPLDEEAAAAIQSEIDAMGDIFYDSVARARGLSVETVRGLKAGTFMGEGGVAVGLADVVASPAAAFQQLLAII